MTFALQLISWKSVEWSFVQNISMSGLFSDPHLVRFAQTQTHKVCSGLIEGERITRVEPVASGHCSHLTFAIQHDICRYVSVVPRYNGSVEDIEAFRGCSELSWFRIIGSANVGDNIRKYDVDSIMIYTRWGAHWGCKGYFGLKSCKIQRNSIINSALHAV